MASQSDVIKDGKPASERESFSEKKPDPKKCSDLGYTLDLDKVELGDRDPHCETDLLQDDAKEFSSKPTNSSVWGKRYDATQDAYGRDLLGQDKNFGDQPVWSQIWYVVTILGVIGTVIGIGYLPVMNQLKAMGYII
ncbi:hypothetical protein ACFSSC_11825 [Corynebacterium mendelii]|uniref:Uncharacterized protein n=1 Tax=Corynebacterium mendelii TaxID=2765362 RepID=A0A939E1L4_9CORY|nr:hypothetical protein [Corynebacterium mendelii]MBN9645310.1 hypothetical protein [Corynebacterium mendelii]